MANIETVKAAYGGYICRRCINREFGARLKPNDCIYEMYPSRCVCCGETRNIVIGFKICGSLKLLLKNAVKATEQG